MNDQNLQMRNNMAKKKPIKKLETNTILFDIFCGEAVTIMLDRDVEQTEQNETTLKTLKTSISVQGYLIELDDQFLYLGYDPDLINQAVPRNHIVHIEMIDGQVDEISNSNPSIKDGGFN